MACNCNKCNPSKPCGCADTALTNPCTYTDCSVGSERCADIQCAECVSYCGTSFQVGGVGTLIKIETGERLDSIIQKFALMVSAGVGACTADDLHHAPYNVYAANITNNSAVIVWNGESTASTLLEIYIDNGGGYVSAGTVLPTILQFDATGLLSATDYTVKITSLDYSNVAVTAPGTGYVTGTAIATTGGTGTGLTVDITAVAGAITAATIANPGSGYLTGDIVTVNSGNVDGTLTITIDTCDSVEILFTTLV
jgi:hypothetical protein